MRRILLLGAAVAVVVLVAVPLVAGADPGARAAGHDVTTPAQARLVNVAHWAQVRDFAEAATTARFIQTKFIEAKFIEAMQLEAAARARRRRACTSDPASFLARTKNRESHGDYGAVSSSGTYRGAYQFDQQTWDSNAAASGRTDLVGADPAAVPPVDQDQIATDTYGRRGSQPWGGGC